MTRPAVPWSLRTRVPFSDPWRQRREWRKWADAAQALILDTCPWYSPFTPQMLSTRNPKAIALIARQLAAFLSSIETLARTDGDEEDALAVLLEHAPTIVQEMAA